MLKTLAGQSPARNLSEKLQRCPIRHTLHRMARKTSTVSGQLRSAILESGLTHYALGKQAGVAPNVLDRFMSGERGLSIGTIDKLCQCLGLDLVKTRRK